MGKDEEGAPAARAPGVRASATTLRIAGAFAALTMLGAALAWVAVGWVAATHADPAGASLASSMQATAAAAGALVGLSGLAAALWTARRLMRVQAAVRCAMRQLAQGHRPKRLATQAEDDVAALAADFDAMAAAVAHREAGLARIAYRDALTGLPNAALLSDRLEQSIARSQGGREPVSLVAIEVRRFRAINDALGHGGGDALLKECASRLREVLRAMTGGDSRRAGPTVARLRGTKFVLLLPGIEAGRAREVALRVLDRLQRPCQWSGQSAVLSACAGVAAFPEHGRSAEELLVAAEEAMAAAQTGPEQVVIHDVASAPDRQVHLLRLEELKKAIDTGQLSLLFQPKISLREATHPMAEALVRWDHPVRGPQNPAVFVPFAEKTGYITQLTRWVIDRALAQLAEWSAQGLSIEVAVNVSAYDLSDPDLPPYIVARLREHAVPPSMLSLEIGEAAIMQEPERARHNLTILERLGVRLAIDDFGTGFSSLPYLRGLPVDALKIDKTFVGTMYDDAGSRAVVRAAIDLAHSLQLRAIAEGVEDGRVLRELCSMGCDAAQGYYFGRPLTPADFALWARRSLGQDERVIEANRGLVSPESDILISV